MALAQANRYLERGDYRAAAEAYERAAAEGQDGGKLLIGWAKALDGDGKADLAVDKIEAALRLDPSNADAYLMEARLLTDLRRPKQALELYERARVAIDHDPVLYVGWGELLAEQGMHEQARWRFESAIALDDRCAPAYMGAGGVLLDLGQPAEAADRFKRVAEELDESGGAAFSGWGRALFELDDYDTALEKFSKALELDAEKSASIDHWLKLGETLNELKRFSEALDAYSNAIALEARFNPPPSLKYLARTGSAQVTLALNAPDKALEYCHEGIELLTAVGLEKSHYVTLLRYLQGGSQTMLKRYADAIASFRRAAAGSDLLAVHAMTAIASTLAGQGKYKEAWHELLGIDDVYERIETLQGSEVDDDQRVAFGTALLWLDRLDDAEAAFKSALGPRRRNASAWIKLMGLYLERREQSVEEASHWQWEAYEAYRRAVPLLEAQRENKSFADPVVGLGLLHFLMDDFDKARQLLTEAARLDAESAIPSAGLGMVPVRRGEHAAAVEQFQLALKRDADNLTVQCHLADAYFRLGHRDAALDSYEGVLRIAPDNVGAHIGAGEVLIEQAQEGPSLFRVGLGAGVRSLGRCEMSSCFRRRWG